MNLDPSQLREQVGYHLLREMVSLPSIDPRPVVVNGEFVGLFALTENVVGHHRASFNDGTGNLYKEVWPFTASGTLTGEAVYLDSLRTNEGTRSCVPDPIVRRGAVGSTILRRSCAGT